MYDVQRPETPAPPYSEMSAPEKKESLQQQQPQQQSLPPPPPPQQPAEMERIRHLPEWETPVNPPKKSYWSRVQFPQMPQRNHRHVAGAHPQQSKPPSAAPGTAVSNNTAVTSSDLSRSSLQKETAASALPATTAAAAPRASSEGAASTSSSQRPTFRSRFDAAFPPHRTYLCGLTRRAFLLTIGILIALVILALGLGLGLGLRNKNSRTSTEDLPLPSNGHRAYEGDLTYYAPGLGACGWENNDQEFVVAVSHEVFDAAGANAAAGGNPNQNPLCGRHIRVTMRAPDDDDDGMDSEVDVTVVDRCTACKPTDLDLSKGVFTQLASESKGRVVGEWHWLE